MGKAGPKEIYFLLDAAYRHRDAPDFAAAINTEIAESDLLTSNFRSDTQRSDSWRDYQQLLPEVGLQVSTVYTKRPVLTELGLMYLDGEIGYRELFTTQSLAYQYPNGHKSDFTKQTPEDLASRFTSRVGLELTDGILIKPGVLILRTMLALLQQGKAPTITTRECLHALKPTKRNRDWPEAVERLLWTRRNGLTGHSDPAHLRHIQEWFRFLSFGDLVTRVGQSQVTLSSTAIADLENLNDVLSYHEDEDTFWFPVGDDTRINALSWFRQYGNPDIERQWYQPPEARTHEYLEENYPVAAEPEVDDIRDVVLNSEDIRLRPFSARDFNFGDFVPPPVNGLAAGRRKLEQQTREHENIVKAVAEKLTTAGFAVFDDPCSVDLLALRGDDEVIFEIKTITARNRWPRLRLGVGQLSEYRYRRKTQTGRRPNAVLVLGNKLGASTWLPRYFESELDMGLVSFKSDVFLPITNGPMERELLQS